MVVGSRVQWQGTRVRAGLATDGAGAVSVAGTRMHVLFQGAIPGFFFLHEFVSGELYYTNPKQIRLIRWTNDRGRLTKIGARSRDFGHDKIQSFKTSAQEL